MSIKIGSATVIADDLGITAGDSTLNSLTVANETTTTSLQVTGNNIPRLTLSNPQYDAATYRFETSIQALNISNVLNGVSRPRITIEDNGHVSIPDGNLTVAQGNLLVGKTVTTLNTPGNVLYEAGGGQFTVPNGISMYLNRTNSDGDIVGFYKDGTTVGSIASRLGVVSSIILDPRTGGAGLTGGGPGAIIPTGNTGASTDGVADLGADDGRWKDLYLSGGVYLGGTGPANHLDDYEEGTWTPTLVGAISTPSHTLVQARGEYTKVGNKVTASMYWKGSSISGGSGDVLWASLPFAEYTGAFSAGSVACRFVGGYNQTTLSYGGSSLGILVNTSAASSEWRWLNAGDLGSTTEIHATFTYFTTA